MYIITGFEKNDNTVLLPICPSWKGCFPSTWFENNNNTHFYCKQVPTFTDTTVGDDSSKWHWNPLGDGLFGPFTSVQNKLFLTELSTNQNMACLLKDQCFRIIIYFPEKKTKELRPVVESQPPLESCFISLIDALIGTVCYYYDPVLVALSYFPSNDNNFNSIINGFVRWLQVLLSAVSVAKGQFSILVFCRHY